MTWLKRIFSKDSKDSGKSVKKSEIVGMLNLDYPPKIILAWCKALEGNKDIQLFLLNNGYPEIYHATAAILLNEKAREWLMKNGYPHLMAMINAAEGNESALHWLEVHDFEILYHIANAVEDEMDSFAWLKNNTTEDIFLLAVTIKKVKDEIESNHNDTHSYGRDM